MGATEPRLIQLIRQGESLTVEFKSDAHCLPDRELLSAVVALANTEGGELLLGVEDDGAITGLHVKHADLAALPALIASRTNPSIAVQVERFELEGQTVARITVPKSRQLVATSDGLLRRRRLKYDGTPEAVPFYPHEFMQRQSSMGIIDPSALPMKDVSLEELDPLQHHRIRNAIKKYGGDLSLIPLADDELEGALGLVITSNGIRCPTVAGLLLLGTENLLRRRLPSHEAAFQVLRGTDVLVNEFFRKPLLETFEEIQMLFRARVEEEEIQVGLFRVPIPNYDRRAFREAFVNALVHRDYNSLGTVRVKLENDSMSISSPGGFVDGVTIDNLLSADPRSRNPLLADVIKRIGLAERTGRGIDRIFEGMLRYGRSAPDYTLSSPYTVSVRMTSSGADLEFLRMIIKREDQTDEPLPIESLIILSYLRDERRLSTADLAKAVHKDAGHTRAILEQLVEAGMVEAHGAGRGRTYTLSADVYRKKGQKAAYVRQMGFDPIKQEQMVLRFIDAHGKIKRSDVVELCHLNSKQAYRLLTRLKERGEIRQVGERKAAVYERNR